MELCVKKTASDIQFLECFCGQETLFMVGKTSQLITFRSSHSKVSRFGLFRLSKTFLRSAPVSVHGKTRFWFGWTIFCKRLYITEPQASAFVLGNMGKVWFCKDFTLHGLKVIASPRFYDDFKFPQN